MSSTPIPAPMVARTWLFLVLTAAGCGWIGTGAPAPALTPGQDITTWIEPIGTDAGHEFYARNDSDRIYRITRVTLTDCKNVRECGAHRIDVVLCPGESRRIFESRPFDPDHEIERERVFFNWGYAASSYDPGEPVVGADCGRGETR